MTNDLPPHGTRRRQRLGCNCQPCRRVHADYHARVRRLKAYGQWQPFTDAQPVRDHLRHLSRHGIGWKRVADLTGIPPATVNHIAFGRPSRLPARCRTATAEAILAVQPTLDNVADVVPWPAVGTVRRLRALVAIGWPMSHLAEHLPTHPGWAQRIISAGPDAVTARAARAARDLYAQLCMTPAPDTWVNRRTRRMAQQRGWAPPLAWDDDTIDDPAAQPYDGAEDGGEPVDRVAVDRALRGFRTALTAAERHHAVHEGRRRGMGLQQIADVLHLSWSSVRALDRRTLPDVEQVAA